MFSRVAIVARSSTRVPATRAFHTSPVAAKTVTEKVKETAEAVNKKVGETLASGIEKGQQTTNATKATLGVKAEEAKQTASETADLAGQKAKETKHSAAQTADIAGQKTNQAAAGAKVAKEDFVREVKK